MGWVYPVHPQVVEVARWWLVYFAAACALVVAVFSRGFSLPRLKGWEVALLTAMSLSPLPGLAGAGWPLVQEEILNRITAAVLLVAFLNLEWRPVHRRIFRITASGVIIAGLLPSLGIPFGWYSANANIWSQAVLLAAMFTAAVELAVGWKTILLASSFWVVANNESRSAQIACAIIIAGFVWSLRASTWLRSGLVAGVVLTAWGTLSLSNVGKEHSAAMRKHYALESLSAIKNNFWGLGTGNFDFQFVGQEAAFGEKLSMNQVVHSPHNEWLRFVLGDGWIFGACVVLLAALWIAWASQQKSPVLWLAIAVASFVEMSFQFPLQLALPVVCAAAWLGCLLRKEKDKIELKPVWVFPALALYLALAGAVTGVEILELTETGDAKLLAGACRVAPLNWRVCLHASDQALKEDNPARALALLGEELKRRPDNYIAILKQIQLAERFGDDKLASAGLGHLAKLYGSK
ncbi:MAG: hypothetical protein ACXWQE_13490 [Bdellovibrionales bacterium]